MSFELHSEPISNTGFNVFGNIVTEEDTFCPVKQGWRTYHYRIMSSHFHFTAQLLIVIERFAHDGTTDDLKW